MFPFDSPDFSEGAHGLSPKAFSGSSAGLGSQALLPTSKTEMVGEGETASLCSG